MKNLKVLLGDPRHSTVGAHSYFVPIGIGYIGSNLLKHFKKNNIERVLIENNIKTNLRPEELSYNDFINLSNTISNLIKKN